MIKSMTGYGKAETTLESGKLCVEIRSLNGKTADISIKTQLLPKDKEMEVRKMIAAELQRGNIDLFMTYEPNDVDAAKNIHANVLSGYYRQMKSIADGLGIDGLEGRDIILGAMKFPDVIDNQKADIINDDNWPAVDSCIREAVSRLNEFRSTEGAVLYRDVTSKVASILGYVDEVEAFEGERTATVREKILARFEELSLQPDQNRLEEEMVYYIEKFDINEEKTRLRQHCHYFMETIDNEPYPGKKLGFIAQEMGREINTTGSKANHTGIQKIVVKMKDDLEKIKEQSLNIL